MNKVFIFTLGAAVGSLLTWKLIEKKYRDLADEEIESVVEHFKEKVLEVNEKFIFSDEIEPVSEKEEQYNGLTKDLGYDFDEDDDDAIISVDKEGNVYIEPGVDYIKPYVISPEEFDEIEHYDSRSWTLYSDGVITDDIGEIVVDPENYIGDALNHFGQFEDDSVHVRNENIECDYEIIKCEKSFTEINRGIANDISSND